MRASLLLSSMLAVMAQRTFTDDAGVEHTTTKAHPTIAIGALDAVSLMHFGLSASSIKGTFGERGSSGSNKNGNYYDGNAHVPGSVDHGSATYDPSMFPADPTDAEMALLAQTVDLSPGCSSTKYVRFQLPILNALSLPCDHDNAHTRPRTQTRTKL